ncbi:hypothetical protein BH23CHL8_BH23CHL8_18270 [soil metagenome]
MSLPRITAPYRTVVTDRHGRPRTIVAGRRRLAVTAVEIVREEVAAYPIEEGPRTLFIVRAGARRFRVVHRHQERRWLVEALAGDPAVALTSAA